MALRESNELWREIVDSLTDAIVVVSSDLEVLAVNAAAETVLGASHIRRSVTDRLFKHNQWLATMVGRCLASGQSLNYPEASLQLAQREAVVRAEVSPLMNARGELDGVIILLQDLSYQQGVEPGFRIDPNAVRLSSAGLAHEVKNPLTGIKGAAELMAALFLADPRARQYCGLILDGVERIASLVEQVLAVSRPLRLKREPINIHQVLHQALRMAGAHPNPPEGVAVEQLFDPSLPEVSGDAAALERVFLNLIRNSLEAVAALPNSVCESVVANGGEATPKTGVTAQPSRKLRLKTALESQLRMNLHGRRQQFLRVEVIDSGKGMTPEEIQQIFTPFFTTKASGTGLGLVLSQQIVVQHGGKLWAQIGGIGQETNGASLQSEQSAPWGMTFCVTLPIGPD
ncbi:MAG: PAS domain-containing protein [Deltaproteobacteria bacterium]|nr:PAS domain-containing protein [Deltaproteobacteria bacterium]